MHTIINNIRVDKLSNGQIQLMRRTNQKPDGHHYINFKLGSPQSEDIAFNYLNVDDKTRTAILSWLKNN